MEEKQNKRLNTKTAIILFTVVAALVFFAGLFTASLIERRSERAARLQVVREIPEFEPRNEIWGENYPKEYESYLLMLDTTFKSKHGGSATIDYLEEFPELVVLWAGYAFSRDYKQGRGHAYAIEDIRNDGRGDRKPAAGNLLDLQKPRCTPAHEQAWPGRFLPQEMD